MKFKEPNIRKLMQEVNYRDYLTILEWIKQDYNVPEKTEWYLMQLDATVRNLVSKTSVSTNSRKINFTYGKVGKGFKWTPEARAALMRARRKQVKLKDGRIVSVAEFQQLMRERHKQES